MSEVWSLPGYDVVALIGFGATGEVWRARELSTGDTVALKRLKQDADPAAVEALRREASLLRTLDTPYVVRLRAVVGEGADAVLVLDHAPGGSLATLLIRRGSLEPGEVVTVGAPLAQALAAAHARALVHGDVSPANVLFTGEGMPLLADLGVARIAGEWLAQIDGTAEYVDPSVASGGDPDAAADVWALAAVCHHMLAGTPPHDGASAAAVLDAAASGARAPLGLLAPTAPRALVQAIEAGLSLDPALRPDAATFASLLRRAHAAAPVRLTGGPAAAAPMPVVRPTHAVREAALAPPEVERRNRPSRGVLLAAGLSLLVLVGGVGGWLSGRGSDEGVALPPLAVSAPPSAVPSIVRPAVVPSPAPSPLAAEPDYAALLTELDGARAAAFERADVAALDEVYAPGSPGLAADTRLVEQLAADGRTAHGLRHTVQSVEVVEDAADRAQLQVVDVLAAYEVRDASGAVVSTTPARGAATYAVEMTRTPAGWRLVRVTSA